MSEIENRGFYKLTWIQRLGYGLGGAAITYVTTLVTNVFYLLGDDLAYILLSGGIIAVIYELFIGFILDKCEPKFGKYRSYLLFAGIPISLIGIFAYVFKNQVISASALALILLTLYRLMSPFLSVSISALNASLTRDTHEVTILAITSTVLSNLLNLIFSIEPSELILSNLLSTIPPIIVLCFIPMLRKLIGKKKIFYIFGIISIFGYAMFYIYSRMEHYSIISTIANVITRTCITVIIGFMWALIPEIISYSENAIHRRNSGIINAYVSLFLLIANFVGSTLLAVILSVTGYRAAPVDGTYEKISIDNSLPKSTISFLIICLILIIFCFTQTKERIVSSKQEASSVKISDIWCEFFRNKPLRFFGYIIMVFYTLMNIHFTSTYYLYGMSKQDSMAQEGIRWLNSIIPTILSLLMMLIVHFYDLSDEKVDEINKEIEIRKYQKAFEEN